MLICNIYTKINMYKEFLLIDKHPRNRNNKYKSWLVKQRST